VVAFSLEALTSGQRPQADVCALQIRQMFLKHDNVTAHLYGFIASTATIIAMGAKRIVMGESALLLVHRCSN
jgi:ClpP class serine protease